MSASLLSDLDNLGWLSLFMYGHESHVLDSQQVEIVGRNILVSLFIADNVEVATPLRDKGVDLIAYDSQTFRAVPVQLKTFSNTGFSLNEKYKGMMLAYVWYASQPLKAEVYVMTYNQALEVAGSSFFEKHGKVAITKAGPRILSAIEPYKYRPGYLSNLITR
ncbi:MAG TPA: hypothetical protein VG964_02425 [Candidatus Saccharimonadales bacterium]|nr:hypothetical protein [Candidatus Saccharimonadales bacterium]